jgi:hypothetical protein
MGVTVEPQVKDYWRSNDGINSYHPFTECMSLMRYEQIKRFIHISDPNCSDGDTEEDCDLESPQPQTWTCKVDWLLEHRQSCSQGFRTIGTHASIDEAMIHNTGPSAHKYFMRHKPIPEGYKFLVLAEGGYVYSCGCVRDDQKPGAGCERTPRRSNDIPLLGAVGHFVNENGWVDHIILGLREIEGVHTGENLCSVLVQILSDYQIWTKVGYVVLDNATNNDTMLGAFARHLETLGMPFDPETHRLRCTGHIINQAVKAFLFGNSAEAIRDETDKPGTEQELERWRRCGPLGRAHNICVHSCGSPQRIAEFKELSGGRLIRRDNDTRWNSWFTMLQSMLTPKIRSAIAQYTANS